MSDRRRVALYARVSTVDQHAENQVPLLQAWAERAGFEVAMIEVEQLSGKLHRRPGMDRIMAAVRGHQVHAVAVWRLDRWGRSVANLSSTVHDMVQRHVDFYAVDQGIHLSTNDPTAKLYLHMLAAVAEFEADLISVRTREGLAAARKRGARLGQQPGPCWNCGEAGREDREKKLLRRAGRRVRVCRECHANGVGSAPLVGAPISGGSPNGRSDDSRRDA